MEQVQPPPPPSPQVPPPRALVIATLKWNKNSKPFADAVACVEAYWAHASQMDAETQEQMIQHIKRGHFAHTKSSLKQASSHRLYKAAMKDDAKNTWPVYLILNAMYNTLPAVYVSKVRAAGLTTALVDDTAAYLRAHPNTPKPRRYDTSTPQGLRFQEKWKKLRNVPTTYRKQITETSATTGESGTRQGATTTRSISNAASNSGSVQRNAGLQTATHHETSAANTANTASRPSGGLFDNVPPGLLRAPFGNSSSAPFGNPFGNSSSAPFGNPFRNSSSTLFGPTDANFPSRSLFGTSTTSQSATARSAMGREASAPQQAPAHNVTQRDMSAPQKTPVQSTSGAETKTVAVANQQATPMPPAAQHGTIKQEDNKLQRPVTAQGVVEISDSSSDAESDEIPEEDLEAVFQITEAPTDSAGNVAEPAATMPPSTKKAANTTGHNRADFLVSSAGLSDADNLRVKRLREGENAANLSQPNKRTRVSSMLQEMRTSYDSTTPGATQSETMRDKAQPGMSQMAKDIAELRKENKRLSAENVEIKREMADIVVTVSGVMAAVRKEIDELKAKIE